METNKIFTVSMKLPSSVENKKHLTFKAKSIWCKNDINPEFYDIGFQLINIPTEDLEQIDTLINRFGFQD